MMKSLPKMPSAKITVRCACGCNGLTQSRFVPGHDSTLKGMRLRVERRIWAPGIDDDAAQFDALAEAMSVGQAEATAAEMKIEWKPKATAKTA